MNETNSDPQPFNFEDSSRVEKILAQYPDKRSATLPLLHLALSQHGHITPAVIEAVGRIVDAHPSEIRDTASFYSLLYMKPQGTHVIQICQTLPCSLNGADHLVDHLCRKYQIQPGETTSDGRFTLKKVECLGSCDTAPVVQVNTDYHEGMTMDKLDEVLESLS